MSPEPTRPDKSARSNDDFAREASRKGPGLFRELADFLLHNKKWWLIPILVVLVLMALLIVVAGPGSPLPWIYTLF
ncbi:MAG: DUF5989 family protein [Planctomycetota bacterium]|nr:DUF5989 family protein [Planctomycetota bacterium]